LEFVFDEYNMRALPPHERFQKIVEIFNRADDESVRWDCVWLAGEMAEEVTLKFKQKIAEFLVAILYTDINSIVRHEAAFQIGLHNMRDKIPDLICAIKIDSSDLVKHEAIEALGLLRVHDKDSKDTLQLMTNHKSDAVSDTATFVLKRLERLKGRGEYHGEAIV
jgi:FOG: HEAT repeat